MNKCFILVFAAVVFIASKALAFIEQSADEALSLNNVVSTSTKVSSAPTYVDKTPEKEAVVAAKTIDIRSGVAKNVSLQKEQELIIILPEKNDVYWKVKYDTANISMTDNAKEGSYRKIKFIQTSPKGSSIFFDGVASDGSVVFNKAVYVKVN